jgi:flagellar protein FliL
MSESAESNENPIPAPAKGGKLMTILAIVNFVAVLGLGGYIVYTQQHAAAQSKPQPAKKGAHGDDAAGEHGEGKPEGGHGESAEGGHGEEKAEGEHGGGGHGEEKAAGDHGGGGHAAADDDDDERHKGPLLALESMVTNLAEPDENRYLKVTMQLRITSEAAKAEVESHIVPVRNQILLYLSSLAIEDLSGADNKRAIQKRVKRIANEAMPSSRITEVYFTEFVIQ